MLKRSGYIRKGAKRIRPSKKDLRHLGKGNLAGVMAGEGIFDVMQECDKRTERMQQRRQRRQLAQRSPPRGLLTPAPVRVRPLSRVRFQLMDFRTGFWAQKTATSPVSATPCLHSLPVSCRTNQILNPSYLLLPPTGNAAPAPLQLTQYRKKISQLGTPLPRGLCSSK